MAPGVASSDGRRYSPNPMPSGSSIVVDVGDVPVALTTSDAALLTMLERRFHRFLNHPATPVFEFDITVVPGRRVWTPTPTSRSQPSAGTGSCAAEISMRTGTRTPGAARYGRRCRRTPPTACCASCTRCCSPASRVFCCTPRASVRDGRAFLFTGPSGAGKTTIVRHAPDDVTVLTDEISYVRRQGDAYVAFGTPFAGEWADVGEPISAPIAAIFQLARGSGARAHARSTRRRPCER